MNTILKTSAGFLVALFFVLPASTQASTYYSSSDQAALIAQIEYLLAQLANQQGGSSYYNTYPSNNSYLSYGYGVFTLNASNISRDSASLYGNIGLQSSSQARVWFQYGPDQSMRYQSPSASVYNRGEHNFTANISGLRDNNTYYYRAVADVNGSLQYGQTLSFYTGNGNNNSYNNSYNSGTTFVSSNGSNNSSSRDDDWPDVDTERAYDVDENSAEISGEVDMNDYHNGYVFFVYGEDEDQVEDIEDDYDEYRDIDEDGDDLQKVAVDQDLDNDDDYELKLTSLDDDTDYYFSICVEFEDDDDDEVIVCGGVEDFETDRD